mgnify:CR=1 FL=1
MFGNLRLQCRQYVGNIRRCREMVRLLLHFCYAIRVSFFILSIKILYCIKKLQLVNICKKGGKR